MCACYGWTVQAYVCNGLRVCVIGLREERVYVCVKVTCTVEMQ